MARLGNGDIERAGGEFLVELDLGEEEDVDGVIALDGAGDVGEQVGLAVPDADLAVLLGFGRGCAGNEAELPGVLDDVGGIFRLGGAGRPCFLLLERVEGA